ncbi:MAG: toprim domain-containing protein [Paracoccaceae bacterium]
MLGAVAGGAVRLTNGQGPLVVAEGIETALSLASGLLNGPATVWAALSTSGMSGLALPPDPGRLTVASDGDAPGRGAAHRLADRAHALGWQVSLLPAPDGRDWNDILKMKGEAA